MWEEHGEQKLDSKVESDGGGGALRFKQGIESPCDRDWGSEQKNA